MASICFHKVITNNLEKIPRHGNEWYRFRMSFCDRLYQTLLSCYFKTLIFCATHIIGKVWIIYIKLAKNMGTLLTKKNWKYTDAFQKYAKLYVAKHYLEKHQRPNWFTIAVCHKYITVLLELFIRSEVLPLQIASRPVKPKILSHDSEEKCF